MKKIIFILIVLLSSIPVSSQWIQVGAVPGTQNLYAVKFFDANIGIVGGSTGIWRTTNGGVNWTQQTGMFAISSLWFLSGFLNELTGYATAYAKILKTTDRGITWSEYNLTGGFDGRGGISFFNVNTGVLAGYYGLIFRTTDEGANWYRLDSNWLHAQNGVSVLNTGVGWIAGNSASYEIVKKTVNYGATWQQQSLGFGSLYAITAIDEMIVFTCGFSGKIRRTTNGGTNWVRVDSAGRNLNAVCFVDANTGTCVGNGIILRTTNMGDNWTSQGVMSNVSLYGVSFINSNTGWAVGYNGIVLKTTNGGVTFIEPISNEIPKEFKLEQNYPNPFNPNTKIKFQIPKPSNLKINLFDAAGRTIALLLNQELKPGIYEIGIDGSNYPSGVYYCRMLADEYSETIKLILLK